MKIRFIITFLILAVQANASINYYIDAISGNDLATGTSPAFAWKTLSRVNAATFAAGDVIYFKRGDTFYGSIIVNRSNISFSAYGTGALPIITGFTTVMPTSKGGGIYATTIPDADYRLNMVTLNDTIQRIARWPNYDSAGLQEGWKRFTSGLGTNPDSTTIRGAIFGLNYPGADTTSPKHMVLKNQFYRMINTITTGHRHDSIDYKRSWSMTSGGSNTIERQPDGGRGFFFTRDSSYIDQRGEWYLDSVTKRFLIKGTGTVKVSTVDTAVNIGAKSDVNISNIAFEGFNIYGIFVESGNRTNINNCTFNKIGGAGASIVNSSNSIITYSDFNNCLQTAVRVRNTAKDTCTISHLNVTNIGLLEGMGSFNQKDYSGITAVVRRQLYIGYNNITNSGNAGIDHNGNDVTVEYNYIDGFAKLLQDIGGNYSYNTADGQSNVVVRYNFITNGVGNYAGTITNNVDLAYYYFDGKTYNVNCYGNAAWGQGTNVNGFAFQSNQGKGMVFSNNISYNIKNMGLSLGKLDTTATSITNKNNIYYQVAPGSQYHVSFTDANRNGLTIIQSIQRSLTSDSNFYNKPSNQNFIANLGPSDFKYTLAGWQAATGKDAHSISIVSNSLDSLYTNPTDKVVTRYCAFQTADVYGVIYPAGTFIMQPYTWAFRLYYAPAASNQTNKIRGYKFINKQ